MNEKLREGHEENPSARAKDGAMPQGEFSGPDASGVEAASKPAADPATNTTNRPAALTPPTSPIPVAPAQSQAAADSANAAPVQTVAQPASLEQQLERCMKDVSIPGQMVVNAIMLYAQTMKPGRPIAQADGMRQQVSLCQAIFTAINTLDADFRSVLTAILTILHHERDAAFRETHLFRYWDSVALSKVQRRGFEKIITLLKTLADPKTRQTALRQVDFERLLRYGVTEKGRTRLAAYFGQ